MEHFLLELLRTRRGRVIVAIAAILVGVAFVAIACPEVRNSRRLAASRSVIDADVVETRTTADVHGVSTHYELRYRFHVPGRSETFTYEDAGTGRDGLWCELPSDAWERARSTGHVLVAYVPDDPHVNRPLSAARRVATDAIAGLAAGAVAILFGVTVLAVAVLRAALTPMIPPSRELSPSRTC